ncbi:MAG TPA: NAD-dependent epimerase/dehydratase family protein [Devosia sp.]|nr:NAD-dependent epimerase/dehydratase family protein [Devosia sp.]
MTVAIIGGTGFLGTAVARRLLARNIEPLVIARGQHPVTLPDGARFAAADRMDRGAIASLLRQHQVVAMIDIFALGLKNTQAVLDAAADTGTRYVLTSSTDVYSNYEGLLKKGAPPVRPEPATEDSPLRAMRYPYRGNSRRPQGIGADLFEDYDKILIEEAARADSRFAAVSVRLPMIFGPGDKQHRFGWAIRNAVAGKPFALDARAARWLNSFAYIDDAAEGLVLSALHPAAAGRTYNVAQPFVRSIRQWAETIVPLVAPGVEIVEVGPGEGGVMADRAEASDLSYPLTLDSSRVRTELGYAEVVPESEALRRTIAFEQQSG